MCTKTRLARKDPDGRREHIIMTAAEAFAADGFGATSMSSIAVRLGGSKATLYKYFPSKRQLFEAVVEDRCRQILAPLYEMRSHESEDVREVLTNFGCGFLSAIYEPAALNILRLLHSEGARFPELATTFIRVGSGEVLNKLHATLELFSESGQIKFHNIALAAEQFLGMLKGEHYLRFSIGAMDRPSEEQIASYAESAVKIFLFGLSA